MDFQAIPVIRIFDEDKAKDFYLGFLGMTLDWEHRFGPDFPLYMQVSREGLVLHLSEHSGDGSPVPSCSLTWMHWTHCLLRCRPLRTATHDPVLKRHRGEIGCLK